jgi:hypothetical protein
MMAEKNIIYGIDINKEFVTKSLTLEPNASRSIALGAFKTDELRPPFEVLFEPYNDDYVALSIDSTPVSKDKAENRVIWFCHLHNYWDKPFKVTIRLGRT